MKNILFYGSSFVPEKGGIERYNFTLAGIFIHLGFRVEIISLNDSDIELTRIFSESVGRSNLHFNGFTRNTISSIFRFISEIYGSDIVLIGHRNFLPLILIIKLLAPWKPIIMNAHGIEIWFDQKWIYRFCSTFVDEVWAVSRYTVEKFKSNFNASVPVRLIPNTLPERFYRNSDTGILNKHNDIGIRFLSVCRLVKSENYKGVDFSLSALNLLYMKKKIDSFTYCIVSKGDDVERHKLLIKDFAWKDQVEFMTDLTDDELKRKYEESHVFLLPSTGEGFGIVYLEAMSNGCVCLGSNTGGVPDVIEHLNTGYLVDQPITVQTVAEGIYYLLNPEIRKQLAQNSILKLNEFTEKTVSLKYEIALQKIQGN